MMFELNMKDVILSQKGDRDELLSQNFIPREGMEEFLSVLMQDIIKVVVGPRRAGKSIFALQALKGKDFAYINFDDERIKKVTDYDEIIKGLRQVYGNTKTWLFDEIQNIPDWELFVNRLHRSGINLIITGSNSRLLSKELASHLTGRHFQFQLLPFSFREFLAAKGVSTDQQFGTKQAQGDILRHVSEYLRSGGYPEVVVKGIDHTWYLKTLFDSILLKDIVQRYRIRNVQGLKDLGLYLLTNHSGLSPELQSSSYNNLASILGFKSVATLEKYISYFDEAFLVFVITRFTYKMRQQIKSPKKFYAYDAGMADAVKFKVTESFGGFLENAVAIELRRRRAEFYYYRTENNKEVDFVVRNDLKITELIQVTYDMSHPKTKKREISALIKAAKELRCNSLKIITWDTEEKVDENGQTIQMMPISKWLLSSPQAPERL